jgi:hypothetical protein
MGQRVQSMESRNTDLNPQCCLSPWPGLLHCIVDTLYQAHSTQPKNSKTLKHSSVAILITLSSRYRFDMYLASNFWHNLVLYLLFHIQKTETLVAVIYLKRIFLILFILFFLFLQKQKFVKILKCICFPNFQVFYSETLTIPLLTFVTLRTNQIGST